MGEGKREGGRDRRERERERARHGRKVSYIALGS